MLNTMRYSVVAIAGLGGHAFGSFKDEGSDYMWLRDTLPRDLASDGRGNKIARIMVYGYDSIVATSENAQNLEDLATSFRTSLYELINNSRAQNSRPIIFIGHSLGGLIVKQVRSLLF